MISYIVQCFNTPHYLMTQAQKLVCAAFILPVIFLFTVIVLFIVMKVAK